MNYPEINGLSIDRILAGLEEGPARVGRHVECRDPACPTWAEHAAKGKAFWAHYHPVAEPADAIARIDIAEFRRAGYLQELNRRFLHPLGLALEIVIEQDGSHRLGGVWDYRDDPEGMVYATSGARELDDLIVKARNIDALWADREPARRAALGYMVQPLLAMPDPPPALTG